MGAAIKVSSVSKSFPSKEGALSKVSFSVKKGEVLGILGESGSGKSTLLRLMAGLEDADEGSVVIGGETITGPADNLVPGYDFISLMNQQFQLQRFKTISENIASEIYFLAPDDREERVKELLALCRLTDKADCQPHELSGGQQQRVAIAIALAGDPDVVLMDEPFSSLDTRLKAIIRQEIIEILRQAGVTVVMVSHDHADALSVADRIMVLKDGKKVQLDTPEALYHAPKNEYAARFLGPINYLFDGRAVRPEQIRIAAEGPYSGKVKAHTFQGMHYHIQVQSTLSDTSILLYAPHKVEAGQTVRFAIDSKRETYE